MRIGIAYDLAPVIRSAEGPDDRYEEFDKPETVAALASVLEGEGWDVTHLGDGRELLEQVLRDPPDLVWNLAEGEGAGRCRESRVPAALEMLGIPYTGSDPLTLAMSLDKPLAKRLVRDAVAVPSGITLERLDDRDRLEAQLASGACGPAPWIVKPSWEGSSKGIRARSLVDEPESASSLAASLLRDYDQPVMIEEYVEGDEVTVGLTGNGPTAEVLGVMRVRPRNGMPRFVYSLEVKRDWDVNVQYEAPADLPAPIIGRIKAAALAAYRALGCRDLARIDFRVREGTPYFLEANPLPGLAPDWSDLVILAKGHGLSHAGLIVKVLDAALGRLKLPRPGRRT